MGALLSADGRVDSELSRRLGMAAADFRSLQKLWGHANVPVAQKLRFFEALILSRLQYGLATMWLVTSQRRRLDGFYCRCLRQILRIPPAYVSRISNATVLQRAGAIPFSKQMLIKQLTLFGRVARFPAESALRNSTFHGNTFELHIGRFVRRVGRPRQDWSSHVLKAATESIGWSDVCALVSDRSDGSWQRWVSRVKLACQSP